MLIIFSPESGFPLQAGHVRVHEVLRQVLAGRARLLLQADEAAQQVRRQGPQAGQELPILIKTLSDKVVL